MTAPSSAGPGPKRRLLILGGTADGRALAAAVIDRLGDRLEVISALAGRTRAPRRPPGEVRIGGFGGAEGLARYLHEAQIDYLIDATHPFAQTISAHAARAAASQATPRVVLLRAPPLSRPGDRWIEVDSMAAAPAAIPETAERVLLATGQRGLVCFGARPEPWYLVRLIEPPADAIPLPRHRLILARASDDPEEERVLLAEHGIDCIVMRESGGAAAEAKLVAARGLGLAVVLINRPAPPAGPAVGSIDAAVRWLAAKIDDRS